MYGFLLINGHRIASMEFKGSQRYESFTCEKTQG